MKKLSFRLVINFDLLTITKVQVNVVPLDILPIGLDAKTRRRKATAKQFRTYCDYLDFGSIDVML